MNDRIKELAEQAGLVDYVVLGRIESKESVLETFAELIIQECYEAVTSRYKALLEDEEMMKDQYWKGYVSGSYDAASEIRQCFDSVDFDH
jgi:hypothetical protein